MFVIKDKEGKYYSKTGAWRDIDHAKTFSKTVGENTIEVLCGTSSGHFSTSSGEFCSIDNIKLVEVHLQEVEND